MYLAGFYLGDGWIRRWSGKNKQAVVFGINKDKHKLLTNEIGPTVCSKENKVTLCSTKLAHWLHANFGALSHGKRLPSWVFGHPLREHLLRGYLDTDGHHKNNGFSAVSVSRQLAYGVASLANTLGYAAAVSFVRTSATTIIEGRTVNQSDYWQVCAFHQSVSRKSRVRQGYLLRTCSAFTPLKGEHTVYNLEVAHDNSYTVNNAVVHNCQSFSIAGLRKGLDDPRGNLALVYLGIAERFRPRWILWENVPGVLSSYTGPKPPSDLEEGQEWETEETSDFECFLSALVQLGYGFAYRVLDAQFFGVPQRRRRVFVVGYLGDWRRATAVLSERHSLQGDPPPSREKRQGTPQDIGGSTPVHSTGAGYWREGIGTLRGRSQDSHENLVCAEYYEHHPHDSRVAGPLNTANTVSARYGTGGGNCPLVLAHGQANAELVKDGSPALTCNHEAPIVCHSIVAANTGSNGLGVSNQIAPTLDQAGPASVAFTQNDAGRDAGCEVAPTLRSGGSGGLPMQAVALRSGGNGGLPMQVRRLTPTECERLQGFPDNYTQIPWRGKEAKDCPLGHRYKALGNSMAVPVMRWIGERIAMVDSI